MSELTNILARGDDDWIKIVSGIVVLVLWALSALGSATGKKKKDEQRRRQYGRMPEDVAARGSPMRIPPPPPPIPTQQRPQQAKGKSRGGGQKGKKGQKRQTAFATAAQVAPAEVARPVASYYSTPTAPPVNDMPGRAKSTTAAPANRIGRLLRRPDSLRAAFVLNELISQPVALRDQTPGR